MVLLQHGPGPYKVLHDVDRVSESTVCWPRPVPSDCLPSVWNNAPLAPKSTFSNSHQPMEQHGLCQTMPLGLILNHTYDLMTQFKANIAVSNVLGAILYWNRY